MSRFLDALELVEAGQVKLYCPGEERRIFIVESNGEEYHVPVDLKTGNPFCKCKRKHYNKEETCKHEIATIIQNARYEREKAQ